MKLFVDTDSDTRLARRGIVYYFYYEFTFINYVFIYFVVPRDINERGRDLDQVLHQYMNFVKPAFEEFCSPVSSSFLNFL